ncbi:MAG: hypothetical protein IAF02_04260 [Anaerolineae bacterium]|nr:hypothetical protein [Anaerolineae bacterium]
MTDDIRTELEKKVLKAHVENAFFRWESAVTIAATLLSMVGFALAGNPSASAVSLLVGSIIEGVIVASSLTDKELKRKVENELTRRKFDIKKIEDKHLQAQFLQAQDYQKRIEIAIDEQSDSLLKDELIQTSVQMDDWLDNIYNLAEKISRYRRRQERITLDKNQAWRRIKELQTKYEFEGDPAIKNQVDTTIKALQQQYNILDSVENTMQRAELQLENSLAQLGTIYSQAILVDAKDIDSSRARRLRQEISEEVTELNDVLLAMDEVYAQESN